MFIISDFHDYYDVGMKTGVDRQLPYRRVRREEETSLHFLSYGYFDCHFSYVLIGFAGKVYPAIEYHNTAGELVYFYRKEQITEEWYDHIVKVKGYDDAREKDLKEFLKRLNADINHCFQLCDDKQAIALFEQYKTAIFVFASRPTIITRYYRRRNNRIIINDALKQYQFQKVLPPIEAFQELAMYVGCNLTRPTIEEPPIDDKTKADIHGFDKFSFRKDKKKKK